MSGSDPRQLAAHFYASVLCECPDGADLVLSELLELHHAQTGRNSARHAGKILRGSVRVGRPACDDRSALRKIASFPPWKRHEAVGIVAKWRAGHGASAKKVKSTGQRLRKKMRAQFKMREIDLRTALTCYELNNERDPKEIQVDDGSSSR